MKKIVVLAFTLFFAISALAQSTEKKASTPMLPKEEKTFSQPHKAPEIDCEIDKETGIKVCTGVISAYRSQYGGCCHFDFRTNSTYCH